MTHPSDPRLREPPSPTEVAYQLAMMRQLRARFATAFREEPLVGRLRPRAPHSKGVAAHRKPLELEQDLRVPAERKGLRPALPHERAVGDRARQPDAGGRAGADDQALTGIAVAEPAVELLGLVEADLDRSPLPFEIQLSDAGHAHNESREGYALSLRNPRASPD